MEIVLDSYASRTCAVKTWNTYAPGLVPPEVDESLHESFTGASSYHDEVIEQLLGVFTGSLIDLRPLHSESFAVQEAACVSAMDSGAEVIIGAMLPRDPVGHRSGRPQLLIRGAASRKGPGYHPVQVKHHRIHEKRASGRNHTFWVDASTLARPLRGASFRIPDRVISSSSRGGDLLQVAHYWRLLETSGYAASGPPLAGIIGTDGVANVTLPTLTWLPLDEEFIRTFSRSSETGWTLRSILQRYDHEHAFRVRIAANALRHGEEEPLVWPIRNRECDSCAWWEICLPHLETADLSLRIDKAPLDIREIRVLRQLGIATIADLAEADLRELLPRYLPEVRHRHEAGERLETAAHRARMIRDGIELERLTEGPIEVPRADIEIDFDIETAQDERVYLWGFLVDDTRTDDPPYFRHFSRYADLNNVGEWDLAREAMGWLHSLVEGGASVRVYHYSAYEVVRLSKLARASRDPVLARALRYAKGEFCDLFVLMQEHWFGVHGLGLKQVAAAGPGFTWRDEDPGGLNSQAWFEDAVHAVTAVERKEARTRVLQYNEDDVRATHALRQWLRTQDERTQD